MSNFQREGKRVSITAQVSIDIPEPDFNDVAEKGFHKKLLGRPSQRVKLNQMKATNYFSKCLSPSQYSILGKISSSET